MVWTPGRICLVGEHNDWAGGQAVVVPHHRGLTIEVEAYESFVVHTILEGTPYSWSPGQDPGLLGLVPSVLTALGAAPPALRVRIYGDLPPGRGFSSSAAVAVGLVRVLGPRVGADVGDPDRVAELAWRAEHEILGVNCGLLDPLACAYARPLHLRFGPQGTRVFPLHPARATLIVGSFSRPRDTRAILAALGAARTTAPVRTALEGFGDAAEAVAKALPAGDHMRIGAEMNRCQALYEEHLLTLPELAAPGLVRAVRRLRDAGAYGAKFSGAGGDGSVVAWMPSDRADAGVTALEGLGIDAEVVQIGMTSPDSGGDRGPSPR